MKNVKVFEHDLKFWGEIVLLFSKNGAQWHIQFDACFTE